MVASSGVLSGGLVVGLSCSSFRSFSLMDGAYRAIARLGAMIRRLPLALIALLALAMPSAAGAVTEPKVRCTPKLPRTLDRDSALENGIKVKVTCNGPAEFFAAITLSGRAELLIDREKHPGADGVTRRTSLPAAGSKTLHIKRIRPAVKRAVVKTKRGEFFLQIGVKNEEGDFVSFPYNNARTKLVP